jgi:hypothetical protein
LSDEAVGVEIGVEIGGEIRAAFGISGSPMHKWFKKSVVQNPRPLECLRSYDEGSIREESCAKYALEMIKPESAI